MQHHCGYIAGGGLGKDLPVQGKHFNKNIKSTFLKHLSQPVFSSEQGLGLLLFFLPIKSYEVLLIGPCKRKSCLESCQ